MFDQALSDFQKAVTANLGGNAWIVLQFLHRKDRYYRSVGKTSFYHSYQAIADATGLSPKQVRTALSKLIDAGMVTKQPNKGVCGTNVWTVVEFPSGQKEVRADAQKGKPVCPKGQAIKAYTNLIEKACIGRCLHALLLRRNVLSWLSWWKRSDPWKSPSTTRCHSRRMPSREELPLVSFNSSWLRC